MITFLRGEFVSKNPAVIVVDVNGMGYEVQISLNTYGHIQHLDKGILHTYLSIKEDAHTLYGFFEKSEREIFTHLISVSGVGANTARMILSAMKPEEVLRAIVSSNASALEKVKGIGKKTAERLVLELKDKLGRTHLESNISVPEYNSSQADSLNALMSLGISRQMAEQAIRKVLASDPDINSTEVLVTRALKAI